MAGESKITTDHEAIMKWAEDRGGHPVRVRGTGDEKGGGPLRIDFDGKEASLQEISWEEFFEQFEDKKLAFLYQDKTADGHESRFFKLVNRDSMGSKHRSENAEYNEYDAIEEENEDEEDDEG